jgi:hypothetical protein
LPTVQQAAIGDCLSFDPFPFDQNGLAPPEVDVGGRQVADALVIAQVIVVGDEGGDLGFEIARQIIVLEQDTVLERLMPANGCAENGCVLDRRLEHRRPWEGDVANDLKIRLESLREAETTRLQRLLALKRMGASLEYDDGRKLDDLLEEAKTAIRNLDQSINELGKAS